MKKKDDLKTTELLEEEYVSYFIKERKDDLEEARRNIFKIEEENRKQFIKKRNEPSLCKINYRVVIKNTQYGKGLKLKEKFHRQYRVNA